MSRDSLIKQARDIGFNKNSIINARWLQEDCTPIDEIFEYTEAGRLFYGCVCIYNPDYDKRWALPVSNKYRHLESSECMFKQIVNDKDLSYQEKLNEAEDLSRRRVKNVIENSVDAYYVFFNLKHTGLLMAKV